MFNKLASKLFRIYNTIINSIAFLPSLISLFYFIFAILFLIINSSESGYKILQKIPVIEIHGASTARAVITSMLTGVVSLTVFSFSMVMVVISQASSNYSPKVIEGLINNRSNQYILGVYIGTILYLLIVLMQVADYEKYNVPHLAIFFGIITSLYCIVLFVQFIHTISNSIQISNITEGIYRVTKKQLIQHASENEKQTTTEVLEWYTYSMDTSDYYQKILEDRLVKILAAHNLVLKMEIDPGVYYIQNTPLFSLNSYVTEKDLMEKIKSNFVFHAGENIADNFFYGFRQLREIGVKALSPGINDPGVAIICLERLTDLFIRLMKYPPAKHVYDEKHRLKIIYKTYSFDDLLKLSLFPLRTYGKQDVIVMIQLLDLYKNVALADHHLTYCSLLNLHVQGVIEEASVSITNSLDQQMMEEKIRSLNRLPENYFRLPLLRKLAKDTEKSKGEK